MKNKILWILAIMPLVVAVIVLQWFPDRIPAHYDVAGNINRWGSKYEQLILPIIIIVFTALWQLLIHYFQNKAGNTADEKKAREAASNATVIYVVAIGEALLFGVMSYTMLFSTYQEAMTNATMASVDISKIVNVMMGLFIVVLGNYMPKCKRNGFVGLRTKWSMANDAAWAMSQRYGGMVFIISGVVVIGISILVGGIISTIIMVGVLLLDTILSVIVSYVAYKKSLTIAR